jgi:hypothetical protein
MPRRRGKEPSIDSATIEDAEVLLRPESRFGGHSFPIEVFLKNEGYGISYSESKASFLLNYPAATYCATYWILSPSQYLLQQLRGNAPLEYLNFGR